MFVIGGLSGIFMASTPVDIHIHDTYFIVAHIHYVLFGGSLFGIFAGLYFWYPKMFGRMMNETLGKIHWFLTFISFNLDFFPMHILGMRGMQRRIYDYSQYAHLKGLQPMNQFMTISLFVLGAAQIILVLNFFLSMRRGKVAGDEPLAREHPGVADLVAAAARELHGQVPTVYRGPYEYSAPERTDDHWPQNEPPGAGPGRGRMPRSRPAGDGAGLHRFAVAHRGRDALPDLRGRAGDVDGVGALRAGLAALLRPPDAADGRGDLLRARPPDGRDDRRDPDGPARRLARPARAAARGSGGWATAALAAVVAQGVLGGLTVIFLLPTAVSVAHACLAQTFFCLVVTIAVVTSPRWRDGGRPATSAILRIGAGTVAVVFLQLLVGAVMRHTRPDWRSRISRWRSAASFRR